VSRPEDRPKSRLEEPDQQQSATLVSMLLNFFVGELRIFVISYRVCETRLEKLAMTKAYYKNS
jgi:hypothetical protein